MELRLKSKFSSNNTEFCYTSNSNDNSELDQYWYNSLNNLDNEYSDFNKKERRKEKWESDEKKHIILLLLLFLRPVKLSQNKISEAKLHRIQSKRSSVIEEKKSEIQENINVRPYKVIT